MKAARAEEGPPDFEDMRREARAACQGAELQEVLDAIQELETGWGRELARDQARISTPGPVPIPLLLFGAAALLFGALLAYEAFDTFATRPAFEVAALALGAASLLFLAGGAAVVSMRIRNRDPGIRISFTPSRALRANLPPLDGKTALILLALIAPAAYVQGGGLTGAALFGLGFAGTPIGIGWWYGKRKAHGRAPWEIFLARLWSVISKAAAVAGAAMFITFGAFMLFDGGGGTLGLRMAAALFLFGMAAWLIGMFFSRR